MLSTLWPVRADAMREVDNQGVRPINPEVVGPPPAGVFGEVRGDTTGDHRDATQGVVALEVLVASSELDLREVALPDLVVVDGVMAGGVSLFEGIGGELE